MNRKKKKKNHIKMVKDRTGKKKDFYQQAAGIRVIGK